MFSRRTSIHALRLYCRAPAPELCRLADGLKEGREGCQNRLRNSRTKETSQVRSRWILTIPLPCPSLVYTRLRWKVGQLLAFLRGKSGDECELTATGQPGLVRSILSEDASALNSKDEVCPSLSTSSKVTSLTLLV